MKKGTFNFYSIKTLSLHTGFVAKNLEELFEKIQKVDDPCIFYHFHDSFLRHHFLSSDFSNDFAVWIKKSLQMDALAEKVSGINTTDFSSVAEIRKKLISVIKPYVDDTKTNKHNSRLLKNKYFHFLSSKSFIFPTKLFAVDLTSFIETIKNISVNSIFFHFFIAHLRMARKTNDFSFWIDTELELKELAEKIKRLNPQMYSLEELRNRIIKYCKEYQ